MIDLGFKGRWTVRFGDEYVCGSTLSSGQQCGDYGKIRPFWVQCNACWKRETCDKMGKNPTGKAT